MQPLGTLCLLLFAGGNVWGRTLPEEVPQSRDNGTDYDMGDKLYMKFIHDEKADLSNGGRAGSATNTHSCDYVRGVPSEMRSAANMGPDGLGYFYQKYTEAYGIPVLGSRYLSDNALRRACYTARFVLADRYQTRNYYYKYYGRFALMGVNEVTTDIPEHTSLGSWWNERARGLGASIGRPVSTGGEENALCLDTDRYRVEDILLHEFAHGIHLLGTRYYIPNFDNRLQTLYNSARSRGLWQNTYAMSTDHEYFAEGVQSYFNVNGYANPPDGIHNHVNTKEALRSYDRSLYDLVQEVFPCDNEYIKRCDKDRAAEQAQVLRLDCDGVVAPTTGPTSGPGVTTPSGGCEDNNLQCSYWASIGECQRNAGYMRIYCKRSCNMCGGATPGPACEDNSPNCGSWASAGECQRNPNYMLVNCKQSCNVC